MSSVAACRLQELQIYRLLHCVQARDTAQVKKLLRVGVHDLVNLTEPHEGKGVLHVAAVANNTDMIEFLLLHGACPDVQDKQGRTPVMLAAELGHDGVVALLAEKHADMKLTDIEGKGVLFYCLCPTKRHARCLQVALNNMADVNNVSHAGIPLFLQACENARECEDMCLSLLEKGADPNSVNQVTGRTALMEAVRAGAVGLVRAILKRGANVNTLDSKRFNAVHFAAEGGYFEILQVLSAYVADMGVMTAEGNTALHYAAQGGFADCCRFLAQRGCNPKQKNMEGLLPRQIAKDLDHKASVKELKKAERLNGKLLKSCTNESWALTLYDWSHENEAELRKAFEFTSCGITNSEMVSFENFISVLQDFQAPINDDHVRKIQLAHDKRRQGLININDFFKGVRYLPRTLVMTSYELNRTKKRVGKSGKGKKKSKLNLPMPICVISPENVYRQDDRGPPHFMIEKYQLFTDTNRFNQDHPPRHPIEDDSAWYKDEPEKTYININYCVKTGDIESLKMAFSRKVPVDVKDRFYKTPLMTACASGNYEVVNFLLNLGADVNACDQFCWTPLHHACHAGQLDIIKQLVEAGAAVNTPTFSGATPLMRAIESSRPCCVDYLIKAGATVTAANKSEQSCLDIAHAYADFRIVELIQAKIDSLWKPKDHKKDKPIKPQAKPRPATGTSEEKGAVPTPQASEYFATSTLKTEAQANSVILHSTRITSGALKKVDISFVPKTVWCKQLTTCQLMEKKEKRRQRFTHEVDFDDLEMPFNKNIEKNALELSQIFEHN
ncbi:ankyrin repeat and EF-hand domain-containing protein 1a isoform X2 [Ictalurus furcatus]|uniref:ankyrin repeat and EF-hand domain-containing protein 1a isoform X2 n=1 Tax=Ictalurus furcatus TaxID=66913 RepID=UPI00235012BC|nr:ankyrin repeat and EF-hand domain-containing protein 1a isoform X2 [Ictalurus furcatus]